MEDLLLFILVISLAYWVLQQRTETPTRAPVHMTEPPDEPPDEPPPPQVGSACAAVPGELHYDTHALSYVHKLQPSTEEIHCVVEKCRLLQEGCTGLEWI